MTHENVGREKLGRRTFGSMALGAAAGLLALEQRAAAGTQEQGAVASGIDPGLLIAAPNVCRGLNSCRGEGKGQHECAGRAACASAPAHDCSGLNECKGLGGCGGYPGQSACSGKGECAVPLSADTWKLARKQFEKLMTLAEKPFGAPPAARR